MAIAFACPGCGKRFKVEDDKANRKGKCPACDTVFQIPAATETAPDWSAPPRRSREADDMDERAELRRRAAAQEDDDRPRREPVADEYDDDEYQGERPKKRRKKSKRGISTGRIVGLAAGAVGLLVLVGLGIWLLVWMIRSGGVMDDLKYLPDDSQLFISFNVDRITASDLYKRLRQETTLLNNFDQRTVGDFGQNLTDVQRMTIAGNMEDETFLVVVRGKKAFVLEDIATKGKTKYPQEAVYGGHKVRHNGTEGVAVVERKTAVVGTLATLKKVLERGGTKANLSPGLQALLKELDFAKPAAVAMDFRAAANQPGRPGGGLPLPLAGQNPDSGPESLTAHLELGTATVAHATLTCKGAAEAEELKKEIDAGLAMFRGPIPFPGVPREAMGMAKSVQVTVNGNKVSISANVDNNTLVELAKKLPKFDVP